MSDMTDLSTTNVRQSQQPFRSRRAGFNLLALAVALVAAVPVRVAAAQPGACPEAGPTVVMQGELPRLLARLDQKRSLKIVAIGSSSTAGAGAFEPGEQLSRPAGGGPGAPLPRAPRGCRQRRGQRAGSPRHACAARSRRARPPSRPGDLAVRQQRPAARPPPGGVGGRREDRHRAHQGYRCRSGPDGPAACAADRQRPCPRRASWR